MAVITQLSSTLSHNQHIYPLAMQQDDHLYIGSTRYNSTYSWYISRVDSSLNVSNQNVENGVEPDDHNAACILAVSNNDVLGFGTRHSESLVVNRWKTTAGSNSFTSLSNLSVASLGVEKTTYVQALYKDNNVWLFTRVGRTKWVIFKSTDWGLNWSNPYIFLESALDQVYITLRQFGDDVKFTVFYNPTASEVILNYGEIDLSTGDVYVSGSSIGNINGTSLPLEPADLEELIPTYRTDQRIRFWDIGIAHNKTVLAYEMWENDCSEGGTNGNESRIYFAIRDDVNYVFEIKEARFGLGKVMYSATGPHYSGGVAFGDNNEIISAEEGEGVRRIKHRTIASDFTAETSVNLITTGNPVRPMKVVGRNAVVIMKYDTYTSFTNFSGTGTYLIDL